MLRYIDRSMQTMAVMLSVITKITSKESNIVNNKITLASTYSMLFKTLASGDEDNEVQPVTFMVAGDDVTEVQSVTFMLADDDVTEVLPVTFMLTSGLDLPEHRHLHVY